LRRPQWDVHSPLLRHSEIVTDVIAFLGNEKSIDGRRLFRMDQTKLSSGHTELNCT
jgi:hypothetical protein